MHVVIVVHSFYPNIGGGERYAQMVAEFLLDRGHRVEVVTAPWALWYGEFREARVKNRPKIINGVKVTTLPYGEFIFDVGWVLKFVPFFGKIICRRLMKRIQTKFFKGFKNYLRSVSPEVVLALPHFHFLVQCAALAKRELGYGLVCVPLLHESASHWSTVEMQKVIDHCDAVVALTPSEAKRLADGYRVPEGKIFTSGNSAKPASTLVELTSPPTVLILGRRVLYKGFSILIEAMQKVWREHPQAQLVLAGAKWGDEKQIQALIGALSPEHAANVSSILNFSEADRAKLLNASWCLVLPSAEEVFPTVIVEAWAHGRPVIVVDSDNNRDILQPGHGGLFFDEANVEQLASRISEILNDRSRATEMGLRGYERLRTVYSPENILLPLEKALELACCREPSAHAGRKLS